MSAKSLRSEIPIDSRKAIETQNPSPSNRAADGLREIPIDSRKAIETWTVGFSFSSSPSSSEIPIDSRKAIETSPRHYGLFRSHLPDQ